MNAKNAKDYLPFVQALIDGKVVQYRLQEDTWSTGGDVDFSLPPDQYRIKPEPRDVWVNYYPDQLNSLHENFMSAARRATYGTVTRHYREVIE